MFRDDIASKSKYRFSACEGTEYLNYFFLTREKVLYYLKNDLANNDYFHQMDTPNIQSASLLRLINENINETAENNEKNYYDTKSVLLTALRHVTSYDIPLPQRDILFIQHLAKKFNLFGRVASKYDNKFIPITNKFDCILTYALLSIVSLYLFERMNKYDLLDLALKINDLIKDFNFSSMSTNEKIACYLALKKESIITKNIIERINANT